MTERSGSVATMERGSDATLEWLRAEFPEWDVRVERTSTGHAERVLWVAAREGHHPQAELSAAKLHSRLADYLEREARRSAARN
jgi:hypothetical protein